MSNREEHQGLKEYEQEWDHIEVPQAKLDQAIYYGMERGKRKRQRLQPLKWSGIAASILIVVLLSTIRLSPTVAAYVSQVPGMHAIVSLISQDKGLQQAMNHDYFQTVDVAVEHEGIKLSVDQIMLDETQMILFYSIDNQSGFYRPRVSRMTLLDDNGEQVDYNGIGWSKTDISEKDPNVQHGKIEFQFTDEFEIPSQMTFVTSMKVFLDDSNGNGPPIKVGEEIKDASEILPSTWLIAFDIDQQKFKALKKIYPINQTVIIEEQLIHFQEAVVYPTKTALKVNFDGNNEKKIFGFDDIRLVNEKGEVFNTSNGLSARGNIYYFESNFFEETETLSLEFTSLRALDKDKLEVILDLEKEQFTQKPDDRLQLESIERGSQGIRVNYRVLLDQSIDETMQYSPLSGTFRDAEGKEFRSSAEGTFTTPEEEYVNNVYIYLPDEEYANPLTFTITNYPDRIEGTTAIPISLVR